MRLRCHNFKKWILAGGLFGLLAVSNLAGAAVKADGDRWVVSPSALVQIRYGTESKQNFAGKEPVTILRGKAANAGSAWLLRYDLSGVAQRETLYASIWIKGKAMGPGISPFFVVYRVANDWDPATVTGATAPARLSRVAEVVIRKNTDGAISLPVTAAVSAGLKSGQVSFLIEMRSAPGASQSVEFNGEAPLAIAKAAGLGLDEVGLMRPVWKGGTMVNETVLPIAHAGRPADGNLAMTPTRILSVRNYALDKTYQERKDYVVDGRTIRLPRGSAIPFFQADELYPTNANAQPGVFKTVDGGYLTFTESAFFNDRQMAVTYEHAASAWAGPVPTPAADLLPGTFARLKAGGPLKMLIFGDSISFGASASGKAGRPPFLPRWCDLLTGALHRFYQADVDTVNASLGGSTSDWGRESVAGLVANEKPDLTILGFGMNDGARMPVAAFTENIRHIMSVIRRENPGAEFILLMSFQPNARWRDLSLMREYLEALRALEGPGVALADLWSMHGYLLGQKTYEDMTGNHVNHPNDFMVRVYAQVLAARLGVQP